MKEQKTTKWSNFNPLCLARHVLRNLWMTVLAGLICVMAVYLLQTLVSKPSYDSQVTFAVTSRSASATASGSIAVTDSVASQFGELLQSNPVRTAAAAEMGLNAFPGTCSVDVPENTNILILTVTAPTPELAFRGALAVMDCYESYADFILASAVLNPINGPTLPSQPSAQASRDRLLRLAGPIGALAMIAVLLLLAVSQETVQTVPGARDQLDTKLLATLRHERKRGALLRNKKSALLISDPTCSFYYTETVHQLRAQVERAHEKDGRQVFLITSCAENEGKSTVAANLALSLAQKHQRVLLLDADLRKPAQSLIFSASPAPGTDLGYLITHRPDREALEKAIVRDEATGLSHLYAAPLRRSQSEALSPDSFRPLLDALRESYSYILIDTPPFSFFADAEVLADAADAAILVVRQDLVPAAVVNDTIDDLNAAHAALLGCVLNNYQSFHFGSRLGGYGYGYGYGSYGGKYGYYGYGSKQGKEAAHGRTDDTRN